LSEINAGRVHIFFHPLRRECRSRSPQGVLLTGGNQPLVSKLHGMMGA